MIVRSVLPNGKSFTPSFPVAVALWILGTTATCSLAQTPQCTGDNDSPYPCTVAGTLLVVSRPSGDLFSSGGGGGGVGGAATTSIINDPQNPGFSVTVRPFLQVSGPTQFSFGGILNLATV